MNLLQGENKLDLFSKKDVAISDMDLNKIKTTAGKIANYNSPSPLDAPEGVDKRDWLKKNMVDPVTNVSLGKYMKDNGLSFRDARREMNNTINNYDEEIRRALIKNTDSKIDLLETIASNTELSTFFQMPEHQKTFYLDQHYMLSNKRLEASSDNLGSFGFSSLLREYGKVSTTNANEHLEEIGFSNILGEYEDTNEKWKTGRIYNMKWDDYVRPTNATEKKEDWYK